jgi:hypothetical protein
VLLALDARIDGVREKLARFVPLLPRALESNVKIGAERDQFLAAADPLLESPQTAARRRYEQKQSALVVQLVRFLTWLGGPNLGIAEHGYLTPRYPNAGNVRQLPTPPQIGMPKERVWTAFYTNYFIFSVLRAR